MTDNLEHIGRRKDRSVWKVWGNVNHIVNLEQWRLGGYPRRLQIFKEPTYGKKKMLILFQFSNRIRASDWQSKMDQGRSEMDVKRSSSQDVCRMKASLPLGGWASWACIPGAGSCSAWVPFPAGKSRRHHFSSLVTTGKLRPFLALTVLMPKGRSVTSKARCPLFTDGGALFSKVNLHWRVERYCVTLPLWQSDWCVFGWSAVLAAAQPRSLHSTRRREKNTSFLVTLQMKARFTPNCSETDLVQDGPGELMKTNRGKSSTRWWRNREEMKSARVPVCLFQSWQHIDLSRMEFLIYKIFLLYYLFHIILEALLFESEK